MTAYSAFANNVCLCFGCACACARANVINPIRKNNNRGYDAFADLPLSLIQLSIYIFARNTHFKSFSQLDFPRSSYYMLLFFSSFSLMNTFLHYEKFIHFVFVVVGWMPFDLHVFGNHCHILSHKSSHFSFTLALLLSLAIWIDTNIGAVRLSSYFNGIVCVCETKTTMIVNLCKCALFFPHCTSICVWAKNSSMRNSLEAWKQHKRHKNHWTCYITYTLDTDTISFLFRLLLIFYPFHQINWHNHMSQWYEKWFIFSKNSGLEFSTKNLFAQAKSNWRVGVFCSHHFFSSELARAYVSNYICCESRQTKMK